VSATIEEVGAQLAEHLDDIAAHFPPGVRITLVIRNPDVGENAGCVIGNDDPASAIAEINRQSRLGSPIPFTSEGLVVSAPSGES